MRSKQVRKARTNQPAFRVKLKKKGNTSLIKLRSKICRFPEDRFFNKKTQELSKGKSSTTFISNIPNIRIPLPPRSLLESIEVEKLKRTKYDIDKTMTLWSFPLLWDSDENLFSVTNDIINKIYNQSASRAESSRPLNSFMAFRMYNAQFGYGLRQNILSCLLASAWHSHPEQQNIWDTFAQQFNFVKPKCGFVEWVDQRYERES